MASERKRPKLESGANIVAYTYKLVKQIGRGSFGTVHRGVNIQSPTKEDVAVKSEPSSQRPSQLRIERKVYKVLKGGTGIPTIKRHGITKIQNQECRVLIMDLLGRNLENRLQYCDWCFSLKTVLMLAIQMIARIEYVHKRNYVYRDINSTNFVIGKGEQRDTIFLIDFGRAKKYRDEDTKKHIKCDTGKILISTPRFASINAHSGIELSRRDDLESLGYLLLYFMRPLPWEGVRTSTCDKHFKRVLDMKSATPVETLCAGHPKAFAKYLTYCRALKFTEAPNYQYLQQLFRTLMDKCEFQYDHRFDWIIKEEDERDSDKTSSQSSS